MVLTAAKRLKQVGGKMALCGMRPTVAVLDRRRIRPAIALRSGVRQSRVASQLTASALFVDHGIVATSGEPHRFHLM